ncbi:MAG: LptF/LptG family permease [Candidatus Brocadiia bacterium]
MTKLQSYTLKEVLKAFIPAFLALLLIMVLGFCVQLIHDGLDVVRLRSIPRYVASFSVPWVLPPAFLTAVILVFGRLAADGEVLAMQVGGVRLRHVMFPVALAGLLLSCVAAYFHFETVPLDRQRIELLKYKAIQQLLVDEVALSSQRQFTFRPYTIQYEDYRDERLINVLVVRGQHGGPPKTVITAKKGWVDARRRTPTDTSRITSEQVERSQRVRFILTDCNVTQFSGSELGGRGTIEAGRMVLNVHFGSDLDDLTTDMKHLPLGLFLRRRKKLKEKVASHKKKFKNPDDKEDELSDHLRALGVRKAGLQRLLKKENQKADRLRREALRDQENIITRQSKQAEEWRERIAKVKKDHVSTLQKIKELRENEGGEENFGEITALRKKAKSLKDRIDALKGKVVAAEENRLEARQKQRKSLQSVREIKKRVAELSEERESVENIMKEWQQKRRQAEEQKDLRELEVRMHRRLALAVAVFMFGLLGMPLGVMTKHRSSMIAFGIGFAFMVIIFYPMLIVGQIAAETGTLPVAAAMWSGNAVTLFIIVLLFWSLMKK